MSSILVSAVISGALLEIGALGPVETPESHITTLVLAKLNRLIDNWNAERAAIYADQTLSFAFTPNLSPHTIGPTGTWVTGQRPVSITAVNVFLETDVRTPVTLRDLDWWNALTTPATTTTFPTDVYYNPTWPNGQLYFWPVPTGAYDVELSVRVVLSEVESADTLSLPPGYVDAIILTLAEDIAPALSRPVDERTSLAARKARARIFANNDRTPSLVTQDAGMPSRGQGGYFNWKSGLMQ